MKNRQDSGSATRSDEIRAQLKEAFFDLAMPLLPKNDLSHWVGRAVHLPLPGVLGTKSVEWFAKYYNINLDEAEYEISQYRTIGELFTRRLKPGARPIADSPVVHPADALISQAGKIENQTLIQAKGKKFSVRDLLRGEHWAPGFEGGSYLTYYLCPTDYHRVHSPVEGEIIWISQIPGTMWPVNSWSVNAIEGLFAQNERIVVIIETAKGKVALVMVAATNVGNMSMSFDQEISTAKRRPKRAPVEKTYQPPRKIKKGEELGIFHMGSTVVMLYEASVVMGSVNQWQGEHVRMGGALT